MKSRIFKIILISWIISLMVYIPFGFGNPVILYDYTNYKAIVLTLGILIYLLILTFLIELVVLYFTFRKDIVEARCSLKFIKSVIIINLFTYPMICNRNLYLNQLIENNFEMIGVSIIETVRDWYDYLEVQNSPWKMDGSYTGLCPDYLNPFNMLDPLFNPQSYENLSHLNVSVLNNLMDYAIAETNRALQLDAYENIQSMIYDVNRPLNNASHAHISLWSHLLKSLHKTTLKGVQYNAMLMFEINNWYWED